VALTNLSYMAYGGHMHMANVAILKNNLSRYLRDVRNGGEVVVMDRETPVARLVPYRAVEESRGDAATAEHAQLEAMVRRGAVTHLGDPNAMVSRAATLNPTPLPAGTPALSDLFQQMRDEERW
jgi:prevent-host-death family protein